MEKEYYLGLDIGTDSVGYAATDTSYKLLKYKGEPMWGAHLFDEAQLCEERRSFRNSRRRLDRRQQRVKFVQELFAKEISKKDENFFIRIAESALWREDASGNIGVFCDKDYTDKDYHRNYPTIHHLLKDLMENKKPHDVRLVYIACAWLVAHRGHFLNEVSKENIEEILDFSNTYNDFMSFFRNNDSITENIWECSDIAYLGIILKKRIGVTAKKKELQEFLYGSTKVSKTTSEEFPYSREGIIKLLAGGQCSPKDLFGKEEYKDVKSISLGQNDEELEEIFDAIGDDSQLILKLKSVYDWSVLCDILKGKDSISSAKIEVYEEHKKDLQALKKFIKKYVPDKYNEVFRITDNKISNYVSYSGNIKSDRKNKDNLKCCKISEFNKYIYDIVKNIIPDKQDEAFFRYMLSKLEISAFLPKQVDSDNRVIPYQLYWTELNRILNNASEYLPFLNGKDKDGYVTKDKILSVFEFRVPYYVGPLNNSGNKFAWIERKAGRITPWNFNEMVDHDISEQRFINRMTNTCTYIPSESVLPKNSLIYEKFNVLNTINKICINNVGITVECKKALFNGLFMKRKNVTVKAIRDFLTLEGYCTKEEAETISGIDTVTNIKASLYSHIAFEKLILSGDLKEDDCERIIFRSVCSESRNRFSKWLEKEYSLLSRENKRYIASLKFKDFGRLSRKFLCEILGTDKASGEVFTVLEALWNTNFNLMELLSDRFTFNVELERIRSKYYSEKTKKIADRLDEMYISNAVKRPIIRTLDIVSDVVKVNGSKPKKIFIEMARGANEEQKGKRTKSRYEQIRELYSKCDEDTRELSARLEAMGDMRDNKLQSDKLFLYYMQLGKCMYSGKEISLDLLFNDKIYDIEHIYPQSKVKDDSIINNKVLVFSEINGEKSDSYPISENIRTDMRSWWDMLLKHNFISAEKHKRLTRHTPFTADEEWGFINRQLVETRQSTKAVATLLKEKYGDVDIVYVKAGLVSEFRHEFDMLKCRSVNDLHHAKDAYLNIVAGNVYNERFTRQWYLDNQRKYSVKIKTLFSHIVEINGCTVWNPEIHFDTVRRTMAKNSVHMTKYAFCRKGGFFDQMPLKASEGLVPLKKGMPTEKYGGYNKTSATFFMAVKYDIGKKSDVMIMPVERLYSDKVLNNNVFALEYARKTISTILGKDVDNVSFPLGMRILKINTMFDFDGFRATLSGKSNGGRQLLISTFTALTCGKEMENYIKKLEVFIEKKKDNPKMSYSPDFDKVYSAKNVELYDILTQKLTDGVFTKRTCNPVSTLVDGREKFLSLDIFDQAKCLMQIVSVFSRNSSGCDLSYINGTVHSAVTRINGNLSNWKKQYANVRIIDTSSSGLFEKASENLLDLL